MTVLLYLLAGIILWLGRQLAWPFFGLLADVFLVAIPGLIWLWWKKNQAWWLLIIAGLLIDLTVVRLLPFYTLASITSLGWLYVVITAYLSQGTTLTKFITLFIWLGLWRLMYLFWLSLGWLVGGQALALSELSPVTFLAWFILGLAVAAGVGIIYHWQQRFKLKG